MSASIVGRRRRGRAEAERLVMEFEQSGLGRREFCARHGLAVGTLDGYRKRRVSGEPVKIVPVELVDGLESKKSTERGVLWLELGNGRRIEVGCDFDGATLERLIAIAGRL